MLDKLKNLEELNVLQKCFATVMPTLAALKNDSDIKPFKNYHLINFRIN